MTVARNQVRLARVLIALSIIMGIVLTFLALLAATAVVLGRVPVPGMWLGAALLFVMLSGAGTTTGVLALRELGDGQVRQAARYAFVAIVLPPPNLLMLLAGGLLYFGSHDSAAVVVAAPG
jgi:hypothetical protein